jgi:hypothetical protein
VQYRSEYARIYRTEAACGLAYSDSVQFKCGGWSHGSVHSFGIVTAIFAQVKGRLAQLGFRYPDGLNSVLQGQINYMIPRPSNCPSKVFARPIPHRRHHLERENSGYLLATQIFRTKNKKARSVIASGLL